MDTKLFAIESTARFADAGQLDDSAQFHARISGGTHNGHVVTVTTAKHNCGAYDYNAVCSCDASYQAPMYGCWQCEHNAEESGDKSR